MWQQSIFRKRLLYFFVNPLFAAVVTAVGVLAGFYGAVNGEVIKHDLPILSDNWVIILFWIAVVIFSLGFSASPWAQAKLTEDAQDLLRVQSDKLLRGTENLERAIRTLPPKGFLGEFTALYDQAFLAYHEVRGSDATKLEFEGAIRLVLAAVVSLAYFFDGKPSKNHVYAANIMLAKNPKALSEEELQSLEAKLKFYEKSVDLKRLEAILELCPALSTSTAKGKADNGAPDDDLPEIALPVSAPYFTHIQGRKVYNVLPGAPYSYSSGEAAGYRNTSTLVAWCQDNGNYPPSMHEELRSYFAKASEIVSFLSVPLRYNGRTVGILNLHSNKEGILGDDGLQLFVPLLCPYVALLCMLLERWEAL